MTSSPATPATRATSRFDGGSGNDTLLGALGNDSLNGGSGSDSVDGAAGNDVIVGGSVLDTDPDTLIGGLGNDSIFGGAGADLIRAGQPGNPFSDAGGSNLVQAGGGNDTVLGSAGSDSLDGGTGNDALVGADFVGVGLTPGRGRGPQQRVAPRPPARSPRGNDIADRGRRGRHPARLRRQRLASTAAGSSTPRAPAAAATDPGRRVQQPARWASATTPSRARSSTSITQIGPQPGRPSSLDPERTPRFCRAPRLSRGGDRPAGALLGRPLPPRGGGAPRPCPGDGRTARCAPDSRADRRVAPLRSIFDRPPSHGSRGRGPSSRGRDDPAAPICGIVSQPHGGGGLRISQRPCRPALDPRSSGGRPPGSGPGARPDRETRTLEPPVRPPELPRPVRPHRAPPDAQAGLPLHLRLGEAAGRLRRRPLHPVPPQRGGLRARPTTSPGASRTAWPTRRGSTTPAGAIPTSAPT